MGKSLKLEEVFGSKNKIRLLELFLDHEAIPLSYIRRKISMNYRNLKIFLEMLISAGLLKEYDIGGIKIYEIDKGNKKVEILMNFLRKWYEK